MKNNKLKKFEEALSARQEMERLIFALNDVLSSWNDDFSFIKKNLTPYDSKTLDQMDDKEEFGKYGWYLGAAKVVDRDITVLKEIVKEYESLLLKRNGNAE